jgi:hypothetical protein
MIPSLTKVTASKQLQDEIDEELKKETPEMTKARKIIDENTEGNDSTGSN